MGYGDRHEGAKLCGVEFAGLKTPGPISVQAMFAKTIK